MSSRGSRVYFPIISRRERSVLSLMAEGYENQEIADRLTISEKTVRGTQVNLMRRWNTPDLSSIIVHALEEGWISVYEVLESRFSKRSAQAS